MAINFIQTVDIINAGTSEPALRITANDSSADAGPIIDLIRENGNGSNADYLGQIKFKGNNSVGTSKVFSKITGKIKTAASGSEDGLFEYAVRSNDVMTIVSRLNENGLTMENGTGITTNLITNLGLYADMDSDTGNTGDILTSVATSGTRWVPQADINVGSSEAVRVAIKNLSGDDLEKGDPVYITGTVGATTTLEVSKASASSASSMPVLGLCDDDLGANEQGYAITGGVLTNVTTSPIDGVTPSEGDTLYVKAGGGLTTTRPTGTGSYVQNVGKVGKVSGGSAGSIIVSSIMRSNDTPNYNTDAILFGGSMGADTANFYYGNNAGTGQLGLNTISANIGDPTDLSFGVQPVIAATKSGGSSLILGNSTQVSTAGALYGAIGFSSSFGGTGTPYSAGGILMKTTVGSVGRQGSDMYFRTRADSYGSTPTDKMILTNDGFLGVGTTSPQEFAHFSNSGTTRMEIESTGTQQTVAYKLTNSVASYASFVSGSDGKLKFWDYSQNNEAMHIAPTTNRLVVNDSIQTPRYVNAPVTINSGFGHTSNSATSWYYMPTGSYPVETTSRREYNSWVAPCDCTVRKIKLKNIGSLGVPLATQTTFRIQRYRDTTLTTVWTGSTHTHSAAYGFVISDLPDVDFLEDDIIYFQFQSNDRINYATAQFVIELTGDYTS